MAGTPHSKDRVTMVSMTIWVELAIIFFIALAGVFFGSRYIGQQWATFPYLYQRSTVLNEPVPGGYLELQVEVNRTKLCANQFYREIYDGKGARVDQYQWFQGAKPIGPDSYTIRIPIPKEAKPGDLARYCFAQSPKCNSLQLAFSYWTPLKCQAFTIKPAE